MYTIQFKTENGWEDWFTFRSKQAAEYEMMLLEEHFSYTTWRII
jgi:SRSO17 transposase